MTMNLTLKEQDELKTLEKKSTKSIEDTYELIQTTTKNTNNIGNPMYGRGWKWCRTCKKYIKWTGVNCPTCHYKLRKYPRASGSRRTDLPRY